MKRSCPPLSRIHHAAALALMMVLMPVAHSAMAGFDLFGSREERSTDLSTFPKWNQMISRDKQARSGSGCSARCARGQWEAFIASLKGIHGQDSLIRTVHSRLNRHRYIKDMVNWGVKDYWATPLQFMSVDGDCEDYAIAKYMALKEMGVETDRMRIVVLQDHHLNALHSVLAVEHGGEVLILDNQIDQVISHRNIRHYRPIYSINEAAWWRHLDR